MFRQLDECWFEFNQLGSAGIQFTKIDHEPTNEYSSYNHTIIKIIKNRKINVEVQKYLKRDERIGHVHIQKRHPINQ